VLDVLGAHGIDAREVRLMPIEPPRAWGLSTNVCMQLGPQVAREEIELKTEGLGKKESKQVAAQVSREVSEKLAEHLAEELQGHSLPFVSRVEAEGAYVNFYYDAPALAAHVVQATLGKTYPELNTEARAALLKDAEAYGHGKPTGKRIMVEYAQPNTHKDFHVGHLRNASIGQAIANLLEFAGNDVLKATYIGDVGAHVAKAIWANRIKHLKGPLEILKASIVLDESAVSDKESIVSREYFYLPGTQSPGQERIDQLPPLDLEFPCEDGSLNPLSYWSAMYKQGHKLFDYISYTGAIEVVIKYRKGILTVYPDPLDIAHNRWLTQWESGDPIARNEWQSSRDDCVSGLTSIFSELHLSFTADPDCWFYESTVEDTKLGQKTAAKLKELGIAVIDDSEEYKGALYIDFEEQAEKFPPEEQKCIRKLGKMTILRSKGTSLYQTKELGLAKHKFDLVRGRFGSDLDESLYVVGAEQKLYFEQVFATLRLWGFPNAENCKHISYELVVLPGGKMSSRKGKIVSYRDLRDEAVKRAIEITTAKGIAGDVAETAHNIAIAAIKYAMLQVTGNQQIVFDFEQALSFSGRAAPYLQYAYARAGKLVAGDVGAGLRPAQGESEPRPYDSTNDTSIPGYELHPSELMLARVLGAFPAVCADAAAHYEPATLCTYLYDLATAFSDFYRDCRVLDADEPMRTFRMRLCAGFRQVMRTGFAILALPLPEEM